MIYQFLLITFIAPNLLLQTLASPEVDKVEAVTPPANNSTYFRRDPQGPGTYEFGYHIRDDKTANIQFREEVRHPNGTVTGSYGYQRPDGKLQVTNYVADENGYRRTNKISRKPASNSTTAAAIPSSTEVPTGLNISTATLPAELVKDVKIKYDIDLGPNASPGDILHPNISDIIEGKVPMTVDNDTSKIGFEVVHNYIPSDFPIVAFELPTPMPTPTPSP